MSSGQLSAKLRRVGNDFAYSNGGIGHWCPACGVMHVFQIGGAEPHFIWDDDVEAPTFIPDQDIVSRGWGKLIAPSRCRYGLVRGIITFSSDCTHELRGQKVPLPDLPPHLIDSPIASTKERP